LKPFNPKKSKILDQDLPGTTAFATAYNPFPLHDFHQTGRPVVADTQFSLDHGDGNLAGFFDDLERRFIFFINVVIVFRRLKIGTAPNFSFL